MIKEFYHPLSFSLKKHMPNIEATSELPISEVEAQIDKFQDAIATLIAGINDPTFDALEGHKLRRRLIGIINSYMVCAYIQKAGSPYIP